MKTIEIEYEKVKLKGIARTLNQQRYDRAMENSFRPYFAEKFTHPRSLRVYLNRKP